MEKKKNNLTIVVIILIILVLGLGGFIIYDKVLNNNKDSNVVDNNQENENNNNEDENNNNNQLVENKLDNIPNEIGNNTESETYFSEYLKYIPLRYVNSELSDYDISDLTKREISMSVWKYIWNNSNDYSSDYSERKMTEREINSFLNKYFDFSNYKIEEMEIKDAHIFGLTKSNGYYIATSAATGYSFANLEINNISYDKNTQKVIVNADDCYYEMGSGEKTILSTVTIEFKKNENNFNVISFKVNK